jgi:response regulator of citrate/malate metabolism
MKPVGTHVGCLPANTRNERDQMLKKVSSHQIIIGLSANSDHETSEEALRAGVDDFFGKPFSLDTFNKMIIKYIHV